MPNCGSAFYLNRHRSINQLSQMIAIDRQLDLENISIARCAAKAPSLPACAQALRLNELRLDDIGIRLLFRWDTRNANALLALRKPSEWRSE